MDRHTQRVYIGELITQCELAMAAAQTVNMNLAAIDERVRAQLARITALSQGVSPLENSPDNGNQIFDQRLHQEVFRNVHSFLTHASNVSKLLWPGVAQRKQGETDQDYLARLDSDGTKPKKVAAARAAARGIALRALLGLDEHQHTLKSRMLRDHLEHYDERLDHWSASSKQRNIVSDYIGPPNQIVGVADTDRMRNFDPSTALFTFRGESYDLSDLATALDELLGVARKKLAELELGLRPLSTKYGGDR